MTLKQHYSIRQQLFTCHYTWKLFTPTTSVFTFAAWTILIRCYISNHIQQKATATKLTTAVVYSDPPSVSGLPCQSQFLDLNRRQFSNCWDWLTDVFSWMSSNINRRLITSTSCAWQSSADLHCFMFYIALPIRKINSSQNFNANAWRQAKMHIHWHKLRE